MGRIPVRIVQSDVDQQASEASELELAAYRARVLAERIKYELEPGDWSQAATRASRAERHCKRAKAKLAVSRAQSKLADERARPDNRKQIEAADKELAKATSELQQAEKGLASESDAYAALGTVYPNSSSGRRTALAEWITDRHNPLTARVQVNRMWQYFFGD